MKQNYPTTVLIVILTTVHFFSSASEPVSHQKTCFQENKGQISDQHFKARPDVLFSGTDGNLVFHLKNNGLSYQLAKVLSWKKSEFYPPFNGVSEGRGMRGARRAGDEGVSEGRGMTNKNESGQANELSIYRIDINWLNCNINATIEKGKTIDGYDNFYSETCPQGALEVKSYKDITYQNLYAGIDLKWYEKNGALKYDYNVAAGADYTQIQLELKGAQSIRINNLAQLIIKTPLGELIEEAPVVKQENKILTSHWKINGEVVSFQIQDIDSNKPFTIDPLVRSWGTYYGGSGNDWVGTTYTDANGNLFVSGGTTSSNLQTIATTGAFQTTYGGGIGSLGDSFLAKFNTSGQRLWGSYFGGSGTDFAFACVVDINGDVYITGGTTTTNSAVITTPGCHQSVFSATNTGIAYLAKFNTSGARIWSTYYGENAQSVGIGVSCDALNNVYLAGSSNSVTATTTLIASSGAHQATFGGGTLDGFLVKFNSAGVRQWGTYYGGNGDDQAFNCITDASGNIYIGGVTSSTNLISTAGCHQPNYGGSSGGGIYLGLGDAFVAKFNTSGLRQWGTYYGGGGDDGIYYLAIDVQSNIYFSGSTNTSSGTAVASASCHQSVYGGGPSDAMLGKFNNSGQLLWGTYYGGPGIEEWCCCFVEKGSGNIYLSGITSSGGTNIATPCAYQNTMRGNKDAFLTKFNLQGTRLWGTYYGGTGVEDWSALTVDGSGAVYLAGETTSSTTANATIISSNAAHQTSYGGGTYDAFIAKFDGCNVVIPTGSLQACQGQSANISLPQSCAIKWFADSLGTNLLYQGATFTTGIINNDTTFWAKDFSCGLNSNSGKVKILTIPSPSLSISITHTFICKGETYTISANGANTYTWATVNSQAASVVLTATNSITHGVDGTGTNGCKGSKTIYIQVDPCVGVDKHTNEESRNFEIFPNPSNGSITLIGNKTAQISISNGLGQIVKTLELSEANQFKMEINDLPNGIYIVRSDSMSLTNKVIILK